MGYAQVGISCKINAHDHLIIRFFSTFHKTYEKLSWEVP
jgi:hypothetical protein